MRRDQTLIYAFYDAVWVLPAAGFIVGFATNYLALLLIFKPVQPKCVKQSPLFYGFDVISNLFVTLSLIWELSFVFLFLCCRGI